MRTALITIAHGRHDHLARQQNALWQGDLTPDTVVVVAMDDPSVEVPRAQVVRVPRDRGALPLAAARNAGVARAVSCGAELLVLLDVDCIPSPTLLSRYVAAAAEHPDGLLSGPVGYLPEAADHPLDQLSRLAVPHPARPVPTDDEIVENDDPTLFWSLSFACTPATWDRIGGFDEAYRGYGGEDTDFGCRTAGLGVSSWWVGGAWAYHQHHDSERPPLRHLDDIVRNAGIFHDRWGWWPMGGWLEEFARRGLAHQDPSGTWVRS